MDSETSDIQLGRDLFERARHHAGMAEELLEEKDRGVDMPAARASFAAAHAALANFYWAEGEAVKRRLMAVD